MSDMSDNSEQSYEEWIAELYARKQAILSGAIQCDHYSTRLDLAKHTQTCNICGVSWTIGQMPPNHKRDGAAKDGDR